MLIGVPAETLPGETRVAVTPETVKKLKAAGHTLRIQSGAGVSASATDEAYVAAGAQITDAAGTVLYESPHKQQRAMRAEHADQINAALQQVAFERVRITLRRDRPQPQQMGLWG